MADKKSFLLYADYRQHLELLTDTERGKLLMALFDYAESGATPELDGMAKMAFSFITAQMDRDNEKFMARCEKNRENIAKRWDKSGKKTPYPNTSEYERIQSNTKHTDNGNEKEIDITPTSPGIEERFNEFWRTYPRKTGKGAAEKVFKRYKPDDALLATMLKALEWQKQTEQWQKDGQIYVPNPATWLSQRRWEDEAPKDNPGRSYDYLT